MDAADVAGVGPLGFSATLISKRIGYHNIFFIFIYRETECVRTVIVQS